MIPSDWEVKFLSEIGSFSKGSGISRSESNSGNLPAIRYGEIYTKHNDYIKAFYSHISKEVANKSTRIYRGDVLFSASGETKEDIGKTVAFLESIEAYAGGDIIIMSPKCPVNSMFLGYILNFPAIAKQKAMKAQGDAVVHITTDSLRKLQVCIPKTTKEQQRIANTLSDVDTLITNLEKLIAKKKNIKQGAMQQLLTGKKRLPGFAPAKPTYKQTELGKIPTDWEVKKIGEFTKLQAGGTPSTLCDEFWGGNIRWMNSGELNNKRIYDVAGRITELGLNSSSTHLIPSNCVLVGLAGQGKTRGTAAINYVELCTNQSIAAMFPSKTHNSEYLYHNIDSRYEELRELSSGDGGRGGLNLGILANLFIALPSKEEQTAIANVLSDMDTEISALETKLAKYRKLKTGMMQQLLTGKIRLA